MKAVRIHQPGGPEVLTHEDVPSPELKPGHALIDVQVAGVNFADIYSRSGVGSYGAWSPSRAHAAGLPMILGREACGVVSAIGEGITHFKVGDLVAYRGIPGSYAEQAVVPERLLAKVPDGIDPKLGAAAMSQGVTAHYLAFSTYPLKPGDTCLVHAGAGGVGLMLIQMAKMAGAYVYTTVSTGEKAEVAKGAGADEVILYTQVDFEEEIKKATNGRGVDAVYDAVGKTTFEQSCRSVARRGCMVLYGSTSGSVENVAIDVLRNGSMYFTWPSLDDYAAEREELDWRPGEVYGWVKSGELKVRIGGTFPLSDAAEAHRQLEGRLSMGKLLLIP